MSLVLWSGGCDSTLVLYKLACEEGTKDSPVRALTIVHGQVGANKEQDHSRKTILREFERRSLHVRVSTIRITPKGKDYAQGTLLQPVLWLTQGVMLLRTNEKLYTGHHQGDVIWAWYSHLARIFESACVVMDRGTSTWVTPLIDNPKSRVLKQLKEEKLLDLCWWCESPKSSKPCGSCTPCKTHETALWSLRRWGM